jgi:ectoine hydroxylase-related dioxygenase (phytanoyl-CoA dioxygenase family)
VLLDKRCDLLLPLRGPCISALDELIGAGSVLGPLLTEVVGADGMLQEIACLISEPGSQQQPVHPDTPFTSEPTLYAAFVALQDVSLDMGPTVYLPGTHTEACHTSFYGGDLGRGKLKTVSPPIAEAFLRSRPVVLGTLKAGDVALYNQQVLHCGSANESPSQTRRQFYISFRNTAVPFDGHATLPFSIRPPFKNKLTLSSMQAELRLLDGATSRVAEGGKAGLLGDLDALDGDP